MHPRKECKCKTSAGTAMLWMVDALKSSGATPPGEIMWPRKWSELLGKSQLGHLADSMQSHK